MPENDIVEAGWAEDAREKTESLVKQWNDAATGPLKLFDGVLRVAWGYPNKQIADFYAGRPPDFDVQAGLMELESTFGVFGFDVNLHRLGIEFSLSRSMDGYWFPRDPDKIVEFHEFSHAYSMSVGMLKYKDWIVVSAVSVSNVVPLREMNWLHLNQCVVSLVEVTDHLDEAPL
ncbi:MAG: hypothetical protein IAG10_24360 [Planctomycetaceae bacterium]|nr:hypothetical protein [Planctomycetaceae bacterium]